MSGHAHTNRLAQETSPYLLQHAHNPVDWFPWGEDAFAKARAENKLVLVSVGYSSCHWCHVMERESFEDDSVAAFMNENFVSIKVDREERPDVDQVYMSAVQLMTGRGGWPLNCFALPDGRPVYGGTYYPKDQWMQVLSDLSETFKREPQRVIGYAEQLHEGVVQSELVKLNPEPATFSKADLNELMKIWREQFDNVEGGPDRAPKFPMPNNYEFLLRQAVLASDDELKDHVLLTLDKMALGGIYDQIGGGFARYSTDRLWKVPHFEKMLYDNAQLVSIYSKAYQLTRKQLYRDVAERTIAFVAREMTAEDGAFYSALDADSEGEEGKFYVWTKPELERLLGPDMELAKEIFNVNARGLWEHGNYILLRDMDDATYAAKKKVDLDQLRLDLDRIREKLMNVRKDRIRPGLDDKALTSWNALMVSGLCEAFAAFGAQEHLAMAERNMALLLTKCRRRDGGLNHSYKDGSSSINGYLEDYSFMVEALLDLYDVTFNEQYLGTAMELVRYATAHFQDPTTGMFFFTSDLDPPLIARKTEIHDNVVPASNSSFAKGLFRLGHLYDDKELIAMSKAMLNNMKPQMSSYPSGHSNWARLMLNWTYPFYEVAITGPQAVERRVEFGQHFVPNGMFLGGTKVSDLPLLEGKLFETTTIFVCENKTCQMPVETVTAALKQMK